MSWKKLPRANHLAVAQDQLLTKQGLIHHLPSLDNGKVALHWLCMKNMKTMLKLTVNMPTKVSGEK